MDVLERFVAGLSDEDFDLLNRDRAFAQQLLDHHSDLERANRGDAKAFERLARRAADDRLEEIERPVPGYSTPPIIPRPKPATRMTVAPNIGQQGFGIPRVARNANRTVNGVMPWRMAGPPVPPMPAAPGSGGHYTYKMPTWPEIGGFAAGAAAAAAELLLPVLPYDHPSGDFDTSTNARTPADEEEESPDERRERCWQNAQKDHKICRAIERQARAAERRGDEAVRAAKERLTALCWASSEERLSNCLAGKPLRPLYTEEPD